MISQIELINENLSTQSTKKVHNHSDQSENTTFIFLLTVSIYPITI